VLEDADKALYQAKKTRNVTVIATDAESVCA
jgi:PleD family two-component response regulator